MMCFFTPDNVLKGKSTVNGKIRTLKLQKKSSSEFSLKLGDTSRVDLSKTEPSLTSWRKGKDSTNHSAEHSPRKDEAVVHSIPAPHMASGEYGDISSMEHVKTLEIKETVDDSKEEPDVGIVLKRLRVSKDIGKVVQTDGNLLRGSDISAISRYEKYKNQEFCLCLICRFLTYNFILLS